MRDGGYALTTIRVRERASACRKARASRTRTRLARTQTRVREHPRIIFAFDEESFAPDRKRTLVTPLLPLKYFAVDLLARTLHRNKINKSRSALMRARCTMRYAKLKRTAQGCGARRRRVETKQKEEKTTF